MTAGILFRVMVARWYVVVACMILVAGFGASVAQNTRTYWAEMQVFFVQPGRGSVGVLDDGAAPSLINFAGLVKRRVASEGSAYELPSSNVTLYGSGIVRGYSITLPNAGNQWAASFTKPVLSVQVTGDSPQEVARTLQDAIAAIDRAAVDLQSKSGAAPGTFITVEPSANVPRIEDVGSTLGSRAKGITVFLVCGLIFAAYTASIVDRFFNSRTGSTRLGPRAAR